MAIATVFGFNFFFGDPGLPRWIKLRAFGIFYELFFFFFLIMKVIINVFLYLYLLVIKPFKLLSKYSLFMLRPALDCVLCSGADVLHTKTYNCLFETEWYHLIVKAVVKRVFFKSNKSITVP